MSEFEEALRNIDVFCKVLVEKIIREEEKTDINIKPIEHLVYKKYIISEQMDSNPINKNFIPLPQLEEPLIDIFEDDNYVRILMQCRCKDQKVAFHIDVDGLEICKKECYHDGEGKEICVDKCQKLNLPVEGLQIGEMITKCNNNEVLEVTIPKAKFS